MGASATSSGAAADTTGCSADVAGASAAASGVTACGAATAGAGVGAADEPCLAGAGDSVPVFAGADESTAATVVEEWITMTSSTTSTCEPDGGFDAALANRPPLAVAKATHAIPNVVVAETMYVIARRRSTRSPFCHRL